MTTRRSFLKALGVGAALAAVPALAKSPVVPKPDKWAWLNKPTYPRTVVASAPATCVDTTIDVVVGHDARVKAHDVLVNLNTREHILIVATSPGRIHVVRGLSSFPMSVDMGDKLLLIPFEV